MLFLQNFLYTMIATIMTLIPAAFLSAYAAIADSNVSDDQFSTVVWAIIDLIAPAVACCGIAALCLAIRTSIIAWLVVAASGFLSFFGSLLKLNKWVLDLSVFAWAPHTVDHYRGAIVLLAIGLGSRTRPLRDGGRRADRDEYVRRTEDRNGTRNGTVERRPEG